MEIAQQKDSVKNVWSNVLAKRATLLLPGYRDERAMTINFVVRSARLADTIVVTRE